MTISIPTDNFDKYLPQFPRKFHSKWEMEGDLISSDKGYPADIY